MPVGWMTALKLVPWGDVIEATPQIMQAARKLLGSTQKPATASAPLGAGGPPVDPVHALQQRVDQLGEEQRASAVLIQSLAEQNAQLVRAVDALRVRSQRLVLGATALGVVTVGLLAWAMTR
ncbi:MAG: hypothetical protein EOO31_09905 [Comamonadaceae bacterium]|nr:MAG: hypothetical protein EOO31_09905 [Comamonadaceae bacterium]